MEDQKFKTGNPFMDSLVKVYWDEVVTSGDHSRKSNIKHRDVVATTMDRWIELLVKENLIKQYQAETLKILTSYPGIPIGYYHQPQKIDLLPRGRYEGKSATMLCDELDIARKMESPKYNPYTNGARLFITKPVFEFDILNQNGRVYKSFSYRNVLSMEERRKIGL